MQMFVNNNLSYGRGYVYNIQYHIVWCTKYRKPVLINETEQSLKESLQQTAETIKINIARYFVRELLKPLPAMVRSQLSANVPDVERRIQVTLATLKVLYPELKKLSTQAA